MSYIRALFCKLFGIFCPKKTLVYFGYVDATSASALVKTAEYTNLVESGISPATTDFAALLARLANYGQRAIFNVAPFLWDLSASPPARYPDTSKWDAFVTSYGSLLSADNVYAFIPFDEPMGWGIQMAGYEQACSTIKASFPWCRIMHVDSSAPSSFVNTQAYVASGGTLPGVDILSIDAYGIHPATDPTFRGVVGYYKKFFPGRKWFYVMDAFWSGIQIAAFGSDIAIMQIIAQDWYEVAKADPDAVGILAFLWTGGDTAWIDAEDFPSSVLYTHKKIGKQIIA